MENKLSFTIRSRELLEVTGEASSISSFNRLGQFDILPIHSNFICLISERLVIRQTDGNIRELQLHNGVVKVLANKVEIYLGIKQST